MENKNTPTILVIFGTTGDLAWKKIIPSLWHLFHSGRLPNNAAIVGFSRRDIPDKELHSFIKDAVIKHGGKEATEKNLSKFYSLFSYCAGTFDNEQSFHSLHSKIADIEGSWGVCANKLFYLAVPPSSFGPIFKNLSAVKLNLPCGGDLGWSRVLIEKPFGSDIAAAKELQALLSTYFKEEQIYRIDHYLFKEIIQGIKNFRFSNNLFENIWDNTTIERIDIRLLESIGAEGRGSFYDPLGALRDVGENHILNMLAALVMEYPESLEIEHIQKIRADVLNNLLPWTIEAVKQNTYRAQYKGYKNIKGVKENSETETYFALKTGLKHPKWKNVPIFMEAGKRMAESRKEMVLTLKHPPRCLLCEKGTHAPNKIVFRLEPNDEIVIHFWAKKPGYEEVLEERAFSFFLYEKESKVQYVEEYGKILRAAMDGIRELFISPEEVEASWRFADPIEKAWKNNIVPLGEYEPGTTPAPKILEAKESLPIGSDKNISSEIGIIGLGKMGGNVARRLSKIGWRVVGYNRTADVVRNLEKEGVDGAYTLSELVQKLKKPRVILTILTAGKPTDEILEQLLKVMDRGDIIIEGANSFYEDTIRRSKLAQKRGVKFIDAGISGGPGGALNGACLMVGGDRKLFQFLKPLFTDMSAPGALAHFEGIGAGHFVKMVHNGIEYGMMQSIAEGFNLLKNGPYKLNMTDITTIYNNGSVVESRLIGWLHDAFVKFGNDLKKLSGSVGFTGEGAWTANVAKKLGFPIKIIDQSVKFRIESQKKPGFAGKVLTGMRNQFGGHSIEKGKMT